MIDKYEQVNKSIIEFSFSLMNLCSPNQIGYCQIIFKQLNHENRWFADVVYNEIIGEKKYPMNFDEKYYLNEKSISKSSLREIRKLISSNINDKRMLLALSKLQNSTMRKSEDDSVLDIATAMESLFSDSSDVLKFKLSTRCSILCSIIKFQRFSAIQVKQGVKTFYDLRSAIIHGNMKKHKQKQSFKINDEEFNTFDFGQNLLRHLLKLIFQNPKFINVDEIDNYYISNK